jgi:transcriptional regulator with XRE-family HTH domain
MSSDLAPICILGMQLSKIIKRLMSEKDLSIAQLSRATFVPAQTLHNWLAGQKPRDVDQVKKVAEYFDVTLDYLLYGIINESHLEPLEKYREEINAGMFEVILRRISQKK